MAHDDLLIVTELLDGQLEETGKGLVAYGSRLAGILQRDWQAITFSPCTPQAAGDFGAYGTPALTVLTDAEDARDTPEMIGGYLAELAAEKEGTIIVLAHNDLGITLAPVVAARLDGALVTEVIAVQRSERGVHLSCQILGSRLSETRVWNEKGFLVMTVPLHCLSTVNLQTTAACTPEVVNFASRSSAADLQAALEKTSLIVERIPADPETVDLTEAEVIFSAGKGCDETVFAQLKELCGLLGTSLGVTRPVYDQRWVDFSRMVGQTGKTVKPRLYLAFGISGSMHHVGGIQESKRIVAVNNDAKAPIFPNSDMGFVADVQDVLPRLLAKVRAAMEERA